MPDGKTHTALNTICSPIFYNIAIQDKSDSNKQNELVELLLTGITMNLSARLPDILEPATNPNHRSFFHSFAFGFLVYKIYERTRDELQVSRDIRKMRGLDSLSLQEVIQIFITAGAGSYLMHLLPDLFTPKRLPLYK